MRAGVNLVVQPNTRLLPLPRVPVCRRYHPRAVPLFPPRLVEYLPHLAPVSTRRCNRGTPQVVTQQEEVTVKSLAHRDALAPGIVVVALGARFEPGEDLKYVPT